MTLDARLIAFADGGAWIGRSPVSTAAQSEDRAPRGLPLARLLAIDPDPSRFRIAALAWSVDSFDPRQRGGDARLCEAIARMVETGRLQVRFLPLFRDDPRGPRAEGAQSLRQIGKGPPPAAAPAAPPASAALAPPPPPLLPKVTEAPEIDYPNAPDQAATLRKAAEDGTPFCAICEAMKAAKAAAGAGA